MHNFNHKFDNVVGFYGRFIIKRKEKNMPLTLSSSKKAFKKNVRAEVHAGKPIKQAVAIAYSTKRKAQKKGK